MKKQSEAKPSLTRLDRQLFDIPGLGKRLYSVPELMRIAGLSRKQVSYWAMKKLLSPAMRDSKARGGRPAYFYSAVEAVKALIFCDMKNRGFSLQQIQKVASNLQKHGVRFDEPEVYLLSDGYSVYYASSDNEVVDILKHHRQMLLVPIHEQVEKLRLVA